MFKILLCEASLVSIKDTVFSLYEVDIALNYDDIQYYTFNKSYDLYIANYCFFSTFDELKKSEDKTKIIFIDEYYSIFNLKNSFKIGDDYIIKPLNIEELQIRVEYHYKKISNQIKHILKYKDFFYHTNSKQLFNKNIKIKLSPSETKLIEIFLSNIDKPLTKNYLFEKLETNSDGTLRVYISKLHKLGFDISYTRSNFSYTLSS